MTKARAVHLQRQDGSVVLVEEVGYFMPLPGEKVLDTVPRQVLNPTDFCIIKSPNGQIYCRSGRNATDRGFFLKPFEEFLTFETASEIKCVLNQQDQYLPHEFLVRTSDQVIITLECRIQYKISDVEKFADQPIQFFEYLKASVQNNLLDRFAQSSLREFNERFGKIARDTLPGTQEYFMQFGIDVIEIMILAHSCVNKKTNELLKDDIKLNIGKQNELRAAQNDVLIQEQANEVRRKQKDLEVTMSMKDNEVAMQEKIMQNTLRVKEMDIELAEELKRTELLEVKRTNDLVEAEFEGRAKGHELKEYFRGVGENLTSREKIDMYDRKCRLETTKLLYAKADKITLYPNGVDVKTFQLDNEEDATLLRASMISSIGLHHGIDKPGSSISVNAV